MAATIIHGSGLRPDDEPPAAELRHSWNYRVIDHGDLLVVHEVHYSGHRPVSCSEMPARVLGETIEDLRDALRKFEAALELPSIPAATFSLPEASK